MVDGVQGVGGAATVDVVGSDGVVDAEPVTRVAVRMVRRLRAAGIDVGPADSEVYVRSLAAVDVADAEQVYWAGRATLVRRPDEVAGYDQVFRAVWGIASGTGDHLGAEAESVDPGLEVGEESAADGPGGSESGGKQSRVPGVVASRHETLRRRDFARCTDDERRELEHLIGRLRIDAPRRPGRRSTPVRRGRGPLDLDRTARASVATLGEPVDPWRRRTRRRARRVVLLLDVSGSMEPYARPLLRFAHAWVRAQPHTEVFAMGTRLTRVTRELSNPDPDRALAAAAELGRDWSGGTRLGASLDRFCRDWGAPGLAHGAVVVVVSDGWERDEPELLASATARLQRLAHCLVWVNPHKASPGYEPLARGMAAALPHVDDFVSGHSLSALDELARVISR